MRKLILPRFLLIASRTSPKVTCARILKPPVTISVIRLTAILIAMSLFAVQASATAISAKSADHQPPHHRKRINKTHAKSRPAAQPAPQLPAWPVNEKPAPARINWDSHGLSIEAANSSLRQILNEISTITGVKIKGLVNDQRIFGNYGPGPAREVLADFLHGLGYNVLMVGGEGQKVPRQIVLTARSKAPASSAATNSVTNRDEYSGTQEPVRTVMPLPVPVRPNPRTPQQILQEMRTERLRLQERLGRQRQNEQQQRDRNGNPQN